MSEERPKAGWLARRREKQRVKRERTGDSPEKQAERSKTHEPTVKDTVNHAGHGLSAGGGLG
jgi:hypothetical protein